MRNKRILNIFLSVCIGLFSVVPAFAAPVDSTTTTTATTTITEATTEVTSVNSEQQTEISEKSQETSEVNMETTTDISEENITLPEETTTNPDIATTSPEVINNATLNENRVTIYFKDTDITCNVKIKNTKTKEITEFNINKNNEWSYSGELEPGIYEIISVKPETEQFKIKKIYNEEKKEIKSFKVEKTGDSIQVINLYPKIRITTGFLYFLRKHIFLDICAVLFIVIYLINKKGYRIPILSNWLDNYRG